MMGRNSESGLWIAVGGIGAILLGLFLGSIRSSTSASNLAFVFLLLTIVVAEFGGRAAGLATAVVSALSLNFFLTEPYLTLAIDKRDDVVAFVALAVCGLVAAAFGRRRVRSSELVRVTRRDLDALERTADALVERAPLDTVLEDLCRTLGLGGLALSRGEERLAAAMPSGPAATPVTHLDQRTLLAPIEQGLRLGRTGFRLPEGGGRIQLGSGDGRLWLDVWEGDPDGLGVDDYRALAVAAAMLALALGAGSAPATPPRAGSRA